MTLPASSPFEAIFRMTPDGAAITRIADGRIVEVNEEFARQTGRRREDLIGKTTVEFGIWPNPDARDRMLEALRNGGGVFQDLEIEFSPDGGTLQTALMAGRTIDFNGEQCLLTLTRNISERKRLERDLAERETKYRQLFEQATDGIFQGDPQGLFVAVNPKGCEIAGYPEEELLGKHIGMLFSPEELKRIPFRFDLLDQGQVVVSQRFLTRKDGSLIPIEMNTRKMKEGTYLAFMRDITERLRAEQDLQLAEEELIRKDTRLKKVVENSQAVIFQLDPSGNFLLSEGGGLARLGLQPGQVVGLSALQVYSGHPEILEALKRGLAGQTVELELRVGEVLFSTRLTPILAPDGSIDSLIGVATDITDRVRAEESLAASRELFSRLFHLSPNLVGVSRLSDGAFLDVNDGFLEATGHRREEVIGHTSLEIGLWKEAEDRLRVMEKIEAAEQAQGVECQLGRKDGSTFFVLASVRRIDVQGEPCVLVVAQDITHRREAENALRMERGLFVGGPVMVFRWKAEAGWPVEYVSPNIEQLLGYTVEEIRQGRPTYADLIHPEDLERVHTEIADHLGRGSHCFEQEYRLRGANGEYRWFYDFTAPGGPGDTPSHYLGYLIDITERRQTEDALRQSQKLESLGVLAGGIAHDFNNLLTAILGNLNLAQAVLPTASDAARHLERMEKTVLRAANLTKQMLAYSGRGRFVVANHDLNGVVREMTHLLEVSIPKKTTLRLFLKEGMLPVEADAAQLHQVVMNLITNASDAIGDKDGVISLSTGVQDIGPGELASVQPNQFLAAGPYATLEVSDTGTGIAPDVLERIFDPFFSTKGSGRGLGLSAMLGILRGHRAGIRIQSAVGKGASFTLFFPLAKALPEEAASEAGSGDCEFAGTALVVDDEPPVRDFACAALERLGFLAVPAADGREGLDLLLAEPDRFALVLLDLTMPRMNGRETLGEIRKVRPDLPVILSSGYSDQASLREVTDQKATLFLQKPYLLKDLSAALRELLGGSGT